MRDEWKIDHNREVDRSDKLITDHDRELDYTDRLSIFKIMLPLSFQCLQTIKHQNLNPMSDG